MDCVSRARVRQAETGRGLGSLTVYLQSFLKSCGTSLKSVTQRNDIIRFLFSRGILLAGWLANVLGTGQPGFGENVRRLPSKPGAGVGLRDRPAAVRRELDEFIRHGWNRQHGEVGYRRGRRVNCHW